MPRKTEELKDRLARYRQIELSAQVTLITARRRGRVEDIDTAAQ